MLFCHVRTTVLSYDVATEKRKFRRTQFRQAQSDTPWLIGQYDKVGLMLFFNDEEIAINK